MENEKMIVNLAPGMSTAELVIREGKAVAQLEPKAPVKTTLNGVIGVVQEYLGKRVATGQFTQERSHIIVNREEVSIELVINEDDEYTRGSVKGKLQLHPKFGEFGINANKIWSPEELGLFFKMNRSFFADKTENMKLVTALMNYEGKVNQQVRQGIDAKGNRTDNFSQVVQSNLPEYFKLRIPIFKGRPAEDLEVETFASVNGRDIRFVLLSPGAEETLESIRDVTIDEELDAIKEIAPNIAIIEE